MGAAGDRGGGGKGPEVDNPQMFATLSFRRDNLSDWCHVDVVSYFYIEEILRGTLREVLL